MYMRYSIVPALGNFVVKKFDDLLETFPCFADWCHYLGMQEYALITAHNLARAIIASNAFKVAFAFSGELCRPQIRFGEYFLYETVQFFAADEGMDIIAFEALLHGMGYWYLDTNFDMSIIQILLDDPESRPPEDRLIQVVADVALVCGPRDEFSMEGMRQQFAEKK